MGSRTAWRETGSFFAGRPANIGAVSTAHRDRGRKEGPMENNVEQNCPLSSAKALLPLTPRW